MMAESERPGHWISLALLAAVALAILGWQLMQPAGMPDQSGAAADRVVPDASARPRTGTVEDPAARPGQNAPTREPVVAAADTAALGWLTARVLDPDGRPAASTWVTMTLEPGARATTIFATDGNGRLALPFPPGPGWPERGSPPIQNEPLTIAFTSSLEPADPFRSGMRGAPPRGGAPRAEISFPRIDPGESVDLGDVLLRHAPLLVEGIAVDASGRPVATAGLRWALACPIPAPVHLEGGLAEPLREDEHFYVWEGGGNRFALFGAAPVLALGTLHLWVRGVDAGLRTFEPFECALGARGVVVPLAAERTITATVILTGTARPEDLEVKVRDRIPRAPGWSDPERAAFEQRDGQVEVTISHVRPGRHEVVFLLGRRLAARFRDVDVPVDEPCTDPRLRSVVIHGR